jgi:hypothetical protein
VELGLALSAAPFLHLCGRLAGETHERLREERALAQWRDHQLLSALAADVEEQKIN